MPLKNIRDGIKQTLEDGIDGFRVYPHPLGSIEPPCGVLVLSPAGSGRVADFDQAMGRGTDTWNFLLYVMVPGGDTEANAELMDEYIDSSGDKSIRRVLFNNKSIGTNNSNAHVAGILAYDQKPQFASLDYLTAVLHIVVHTKGNF